MRLPQFPTERPLTEDERRMAHTVSEVRKQADREVAAAVVDVNLRKWCVEKALAYGQSVDAARQILAFLTEDVRTCNPDRP